jgi:hypothetical protein
MFTTAWEITPTARATPPQRLAVRNGADNRAMTEWMRLGETVGTLAVALACVITAGMIDQNGLYSSRSCRHAFAAAALLLFVCIPVLVIDATGMLGSLGWLALAPLVVSGAVLTALGRRSLVRSGRLASLKAVARHAVVRNPALSPALARPAGFATDPAWVARLTARAEAVHVPVLLLTVADDGPLVELNQN